jgi:hypothetical protein
MILDGLWADDNGVLIRLFDSAWHTAYPSKINVYSSYGQVLKGDCNQVKMLKPILPKDKPILFVREILQTSKYDVYIFKGQIRIRDFKNK